MTDGDGDDPPGAGVVGLSITADSGDKPALRHQSPPGLPAPRSWLKRSHLLIVTSSACDKIPPR